MQPGKRKQPQNIRLASPQHVATISRKKPWRPGHLFLDTQNQSTHWNITTRHLSNHRSSATSVWRSGLDRRPNTTVVFRAAGKDRNTKSSKSNIKSSTIHHLRLDRFLRCYLLARGLTRSCMAALYRIVIFCLGQKNQTVIRLSLPTFLAFPN